MERQLSSWSRYRSLFLIRKTPHEQIKTQSCLRNNYVDHTRQPTTVHLRLWQTVSRDMQAQPSRQQMLWRKGRQACVSISVPRHLETQWNFFRFLLQKTRKTSSGAPQKINIFGWGEEGDQNERDGEGSNEKKKRKNRAQADIAPCDADNFLWLLPGIWTTTLFSAAKRHLNDKTKSSGSKCMT